MDGLAQVQSRIAAIENRFAATPMTAPQPGAAGAGSVAGDGTSPSFAEALTQAQSSLTSTGVVPGVSGLGPVGGTGTGQSVIAEARKYLGVPYLWGGTDPNKGLDCSGFVQLVYKKFGIDLPRVSSDQARQGVAVPNLSQARPGDLLAFGSPVHHIAIYVGDGKMIEAPHTGANVRVIDVYETPTAIRRVLPAASAMSPVSTLSPASALSAVAGKAVAAGTGLPGVPYAEAFTEAGARYGVPAALLAGVARTESGFNPHAVSSSGAQGLMQFMPATAKGLGVDAFNPTSSINGAARYLSGLLRDFGSVDMALAAYNAGPGAVHKYGGIPPYAETQNYVQRVNAAWKDLR